MLEFLLISHYFSNIIPISNQCISKFGISQFFPVGPLVFSCYEKLKAVAEAFQVPYFPNVRAVVAAIVNEDPNQ